ncbi:hypothetical protein IAT40_006373 [Kwoniella sp. CBS 6097]
MEDPSGNTISWTATNVGSDGESCDTADGTRSAITRLSEVSKKVVSYFEEEAQNTPSSNDQTSNLSDAGSSDSSKARETSARARSQCLSEVYLDMLGGDALRPTSADSSGTRKRKLQAKEEISLNILKKQRQNAMEPIYTYREGPNAHCRCNSTTTLFASPKGESGDQGTFTMFYWTEDEEAWDDGVDINVLRYRCTAHASTGKDDVLRGAVSAAEEWIARRQQNNLTGEVEPASKSGPPSKRDGTGRKKKMEEESRGS